MPTLSVVNFNIVCAFLGGFITLFGLVSYLLKERFYLSEALISTIAGLAFSPHGANFIRPYEYALNDEVNLETITLYFTRLVLGVQLVLAGVQLPSKYLKTEWKSLTILLGPGMCVMWISASLLIWALVPDIGILFALSVGACVTPTDPVLSNTIVKGKFADKNIPRDLQQIIIAESGANDGLGYPFLFLGLYLIKYIGDGGAGETGGAGKAIGYWFGETWGYEILLSVVYGFVVGWIAKELLHWAEDRHYVDRESFLVFAVTLALFIVGTCGMIGSDDVLACFIAGNAFTWDDWFRQETKDDSLQPTVDMLLNVAIFIWLGAVCPWHKFVANDVIPIYRLIPLGILILLFKRMPMVLAFHKHIREINEIHQAAFVGFFGPIGISAIFYLYVSREFLRDIEVDGVQRPDAAKLSEVLEVVIWFLVVCSIVVHGLSIPLGKVGLHLPRSISTAISTERRSRSPSMSRGNPRHPARLPSREVSLVRSFRRRRPTTSEIGPYEHSTEERSMSQKVKLFFAGVHRALNPFMATSHDDKKDQAAGDSDSTTRPEISAPQDARLMRGSVAKQAESPPTDRDSAKANSVHSGGDESPSLPAQVYSPPSAGQEAESSRPQSAWQRSIKFGEDTRTQ